MNMKYNYSVKALNGNNQASTKHERTLSQENEGESKIMKIVRARMRQQQDSVH